MYTRYYIGRLSNCGEPCDCYQPVVLDKSPDSEECVWHGASISHPTPEQHVLLLEELAAQCRRMGLKEDSQWPGYWEREV